MTRLLIHFGRVTLMAMLPLIYCSLPVAGQTAATLMGVVTDPAQAVVAGVSIQALNLVSGRLATALTDASGQYRLEGLPPGSYRLATSRAGFAGAVRTVTLEGTQSVTQNFALVPGALENNITITAGRGSARAVVDTPQTVTVTDEAEIEKRRPASPLEALEKTPNLTPIGMNPAGERPRLRGLASNRLLIIIDGERLNNMRSDPLSGVAPGILDVTQLQSAEVVSGAGSSLYGSDAVTGILNLVTKAPARANDRQHFSLRLDGDLNTNGPFGRGAAALSWSSRKLAVRASGSRFESEIYRAGNGAIPLADVVRLGQLATAMGNAIGNTVALTYAVWSLPAKARIPNGQGEGFNSQLDLWFYPTATHSLRYRQLNSQHKNIGFPFITPPYDGRQQFNGFRRLDKHGLRYEGYELAGWLPRLAVGLYRQKYSFADDNFVSAIDAGSSWTIVPDANSPNGARTVLTGNPSAFTTSNYTDGKNTVTSHGFDLQATFAPRIGAHTRFLYTTGVGYLRDLSRDEFSRLDFTVPRRFVTGRASNPDAVYRNPGWFNLVEYEPAQWLRLTGGWRIDNWRSAARVTSGFPLGAEALLLDVSFNRLLANPGRINVEGLRGIAGLVNSVSGLDTDNTSLTGNAGVVVRAPGGIHPYLRWGNSYREPGITERYILRNFGAPNFSILLAANTALKPERGRSLEAGVKVHRACWQASLGYFRNDFSDFLQVAFGNVLFVPADPASGLEPLAPGLPFHGILYAQRTNTARARIQGVEGTSETSLRLSSFGAVTPFATLGWVKGADLTPDQNALALIRQFYNRADTPIPLAGAADDAPLTGITPFRGLFGARYNSVGGAWFGQYQLRYQARVRRADPLDLATNIVTQYGQLAGLDAFAKQSLHGGYTWRGENLRMLFSLGIENLSGRLYFEHFQNAPAPGRALLFGVTFELTK